MYISFIPIYILLIELLTIKYGIFTGICSRDTIFLHSNHTHTDICHVPYKSRGQKIKSNLITMHSFLSKDARLVYDCLLHLTWYYTGLKCQKFARAGSKKDNVLCLIDVYHGKNCYVELK